MRQTSFKQTFIGFILLTSILFGNFSTFAQKRGGTVAGNNQPKKECNSGYIGAYVGKWVGRTPEPARSAPAARIWAATVRVLHINFRPTAQSNSREL